MLVLAVGAVVVAGVVAVMPRSALRLEPVADADVGRAIASTPTARAPGPELTLAQHRVLAQVAGAHLSGSTVVVPVTPTARGTGYGFVPSSELPGGVVALDVHAYTVPWDWRGLVPPAAAARTPAPGPVVGDLGPAYLACRVQPDTGPGCVLTTLVRDQAGRWRIVDAWYLRWVGVDHWPNAPDTTVQVRTYADLSSAQPQYLVAGAVLGEPGSVRLRTTRRDVESAAADRTRLAAGFWTFRALLPDPPESVTAYDAHGRRGATWGVHEDLP